MTLEEAIAGMETLVHKQNTKGPAAVTDDEIRQCLVNLKEARAASGLTIGKSTPKAKPAPVDLSEFFPGAPTNNV